MTMKSLLILCFGLFHSSVQGCIYPTGLTTDPGVPTDGIFRSFFGKSTAATGLRETAIQFRYTSLNDIGVFGAMAAFEPLALDLFGRVNISESRRRCSDAPLFDLHRRTTLAYVAFFDVLWQNPETTDLSVAALESFGLDPDVCEDPMQDCTDVSTPWGFASVLVNEAIEYSMYDGWNADGSLSRDYNQIPYSSDFEVNGNSVHYIPSNSPWELTSKTKWQPLLETDELGFIYWQNHVVPHIGQTGRSYFFSDDDICNRVADDPNYDYDLEMTLAINRAANLTDYQKMEIEFFDGKLSSLVPLSIQFFSRAGISIDSFLGITWATMLQLLSYESTLVAWKEKIRWDAVRPPSLIHSELNDEIITSYAGTTADGETLGTQTFLAQDWEPYVRTMPHSEYPSASACLCQAFAEAMIELTGVDDVTNVIGGPLIFTRQAFSSIYEPLSTPADITLLTYSSWTQVGEICGQTRLDGGMHFTDSVAAGVDLCEGIGTAVLQSLQDLSNGVQPNHVADPNDQNIPYRDCYDTSGSDSSSSD